VREPFALSELARLSFNGLVVCESAFELARQALAFGRVDLHGVLKVALGLLDPLRQGLPQCQQMTFGLAHYFDEDPTLASALVAKATHGLFEAAHEDLALNLKHSGVMGPHVADVLNHLEDFFWAL
jgi:hypothetical protein